MFQKMRLLTKMAIGFGLMILIGSLISLFAWINLTEVEKIVDISDMANSVANYSLQSDRLVREFMLTRDEAAALETGEKLTTGLHKTFGGMETSLRRENDRQTVVSMAKISQTFSSAFSQYVSLDKDNAGLHQQWEQIMNDISSYVDELTGNTIGPSLEKAKTNQDYIAIQEWGEIDNQIKKGVVEPFLKTRIASSYYINDRSEASWTQLEHAMALLGTGVNKWNEVVEYQGKEELKGAGARLKKFIAQYIDVAARFHKNVAAQTDQRTRLVQAGKKLQDMSIKMSEKKKKEMKALISRAVTLLFTLAIGGVIIGLVVAFFITRSIYRPIKRVIKDLGESSVRVETASGQITSASHSLADGASAQAASLEETSSSLEEMASMTKGTADNADQADALMKNTRGVVEKADDSMSELIDSMGSIAKASEETSKIIKTIDEIAFQTNLLALNAAVEAARAGEAGAGFAVVADEVRNLAMRSAEAAQETARLIQDTLKQVNDGSELVGKTNDAFSDVSRSTAKIGELVAEIATASKEQASGIDQINDAVADMDKVVQQNAASSEESASASEDMRNQAGQMKGIVTELAGLIDGASERGQDMEAQNTMSFESAGHEHLPVFEGKADFKMLPDHPVEGENRGEEIIADGDDFKDF